MVGTVSIVLCGRRSDRLLERRFHLAFPLLVAVAGTAASTALDAPVEDGRVLRGRPRYLSQHAGVLGAAAVLSGTAAAGGIAMINSIGNLAGFAGPYAMGWIKDSTGTYAGGLLSLAAASVIAMIIVLALEHDRSLEWVRTASDLVSQSR
jgi:MFS transporter, ACS family, tartrate transporter